MIYLFTYMITQPSQYIITIYNIFADFITLFLKNLLQSRENVNRSKTTKRWKLGSSMQQCLARRRGKSNLTVDGLEGPVRAR